MFEVHLHHVVGQTDFVRLDTREEAEDAYAAGLRHMAQCPLHPRLELLGPDGQVLKSVTRDQVAAM